MKNLINSLLMTTCVILTTIALSGTSFAKEKNKKNTSASGVISDYIEVTTLGKTDQLNKLFTFDFKQTVSTGDKTINYDKSDYQNLLKVNKGLIQNCKTTYSILENDSHCVISKVIMQYNNFSKVEYLTICKEHNEWKISQIATTYK